MSVHSCWLEPIEQGHSSILLHANFSIRGNYNETQDDFICKSWHALGDVGVQVFEASFDEVSVNTLYNKFHTGVTAELDN